MRRKWAPPRPNDQGKMVARDRVMKNICKKMQNTKRLIQFQMNQYFY